MKATDAKLLEIARAAGVRMTVCHHAFHYRKELKGKASAEGYAAFTGLPIEVSQRVFATLDSIPAPVPKAKRQTVAKHALPYQWSMPDEWVDEARKAKNWPLNQVQAEAAKFVRHHAMKGSLFANWRMAWQNWYDAPWKESGKPLPADAPDYADPEVQRAILERIKR